jgi:hypothetical protein
MVFQMLAQLQVLIPGVAAFFDKVIPSPLVAAVAQQRNGNWIVNEVMRFSSKQRLQEIGLSFLEDFSRCITTAAHHSLQTWLCLTCDQAAVEAFSIAFTDCMEVNSSSKTHTAAVHVAHKIEATRQRLHLSPITL